MGTLQRILAAILQFFADVVVWLVEFVVWLIVKWFTLIFDALIAVLNAIPVPTWLTSLATNIGGLDSGVLYFLQPLQLGTGLTWIFSAYLLRFLIRRIPFIG